MIIKRALSKEILRAAKQFPAISLTGPRQSGKTTLVRHIFPQYTYITFEDLDAQNEFSKDPHNFLDQLQASKGVIFDEAQRVPALFSYLQGYIDKYQKPGFYILTGSQNFLLLQSITQSLAGRIAIFSLLPLSIAELKQAALLPDLAQLIINGCYPSIYSKHFPIADWYPTYITTYVERDVRSVINVTSLSMFQTFLKLCAGRVGQIINLASLANDCGISVPTAKGWLSILEASYIIFFLHPHYKNFSKRLIKSPKLYFYDTGLACSLLNISDTNTLNNHYLRGGLFECMVISDLIKQYYNTGDRPWVYFWRDHTGHEVDCLIEKGQYLFPIEIKAGLTITESYTDGIKFWNKIADANPENSFVVYAGEQQTTRNNCNIVGWQSCAQVVDFIQNAHHYRKQQIFREWQKGTKK